MKEISSFSDLCREAGPVGASVGEKLRASITVLSSQEPSRPGRLWQRGPARTPAPPRHPSACPTPAPYKAPFPSGSQAATPNGQPSSDHGAHGAHGALSNPPCQQAPQEPAPTQRHHGPYSTSMHTSVNKQFKQRRTKRSNQKMERLD